VFNGLSKYSSPPNFNFADHVGMFFSPSSAGHISTPLLVALAARVWLSIPLDLASVIGIWKSSSKKNLLALPLGF